MGLITVASWGDDPITVNGAALDSRLTPLVTEINGKLDNDNMKAAAGIVASKLDLSSIAQAMAMTSKIFNQAKGADVASGTSIALGTDGNYFDITGTTTIETITAKQAGTVVTLQFDGALTLDDGAGNLSLQGDFTTAAGYHIKLISDGTNWHEISRTPFLTAAGNAGDVLQSGGAIGSYNWKGIIGARVYKDANQTISNGSWTAVQFNQERFDTDTIHDNATNNTRLTATTAGKYLIGFNGHFAADNVGYRGMRVYVNNTTNIARWQNDALAGSVICPVSLVTLYDMSATDYVEFLGYQTSGGDLDLVSSGNESIEAWMFRVGT